MENASKALLMVAGVLLGVMIITVGVVLFKSFGGSGAQIVGEIEQSKIEEFNNQFLKYYGIEDGISIYDVVTMVNLAKQNNNKLDIVELGEGDLEGYSDNSSYIRVDFLTNKKMEQKPDKYMIDIIKNETFIYEDDEIVNPYKIESYHINPNTQKINYVKIVEK